MSAMSAMCNYGQLVELFPDGCHFLCEKGSKGISSEVSSWGRRRRRRRRVEQSFLFDWGPRCLEIIHKLPPCSSGVILHVSDDHQYCTRRDLAWSPRPRAIYSCLVLLPFTNNRTNSCLLLTKLLADGFVTHSSLVQVYNLISDVLGQLFVLAHDGEVEGVKYDSLDRFLLFTSPVEIRCTLLSLMRTNLCASWAHYWSLGARILAV